MMSAQPTHRNLALIVDEWFDGENRHADGRATFVVREGRVVDILSGDGMAHLPSSGGIVYRGAFLMPGLVDAHVHLFLDGAPTTAAVRAEHLKQPREILIKAAERSAAQSLSAGVTLVRDAGDRHGINHVIREQARQEPARLSQVRSGGLGVKAPKRYGAFMAREVAGPEDIISLVENLSLTNDEIKLILTGIIDFDAGAVTDDAQFSVADARLVVDTALSRGRKTFAHCSGLKGLRVAVAANVHSIEHGFFITEDILREMAGHSLDPDILSGAFSVGQPGRGGMETASSG
jgi:imidazolonepropionase-like amidohydrolase